MKEKIDSTIKYKQKGENEILFMSYFPFYIYAYDEVLGSWKT
jgi:hypothetical protein